MANTRASDPDSAIVALVPSYRPDLSVQAQLDGADIVIPCDADPRTVRWATIAARRLADRRRASMTDHRQAVHDLGTAFLSVGMMADVLTTGGTSSTRVEQLRQIAGQGRDLTWRAGRPGRARYGSLQEIDVATTLTSEVATGDEASRAGPTITVRADGPFPVVVDHSEFVDAIEAIIDNATAAGAETIQCEVRTDRDSVEIRIIDDGCGIPVEWSLKRAHTAFQSGWPENQNEIGLSEAAEFADAAGGELRVLRRDGHAGTCVLLRLPIGRSEEPEQQVQTLPSTRLGPLEAQAEILEGIARRVPLTESLSAVIRAMEAQLPDSICSILLLDRAAGTLSHGASINLPEPFRQAIDGVRIGPQVGSCGTAAYTQRPVVAVDIATDYRWAVFRTLAIRHGLRSCWSTPILDADRGEVLGTFAVYHSKPWKPTPIAIELVNRFTYTASIAIGTYMLFSRLQESESRFRSAFIGAAVGMAVMDMDGVLLQTNPALIAMLGSPGVGRQLGEFLQPMDATSLREAVRSAASCRSASGNESFRLSEVRVTTNDPDSPLWAAMSGSLVSGPDGDPMYFCVELFDLTERRRVAHARREQAVAEAASKTKTDFLALVSHELRTPLNAVIGFAQLMEMGGLTPERQTEGVGHILAAGRHLLQLINDLLDLSGAETGQLEMRLEAVRALDSVHDTIEIVTGLALDRAIVLEVRTENPNLWIRADTQRLRQVLINLVGNAIKFSPSGGRVEISVETDCIAVTDSGPGIREDDLTDLFTPFKRVGEHPAEGSGLGLALSKQLVKLMNGHLDVRSTIGCGSTFWVSLPLASADWVPLLPPKTQETKNEAGGIVLSVEDDPACARLIESSLTQTSAITVVSVKTLAEAWDLLDDPSQRIDLILLDIQLPDGNGWDLIRRVRTELPGRDVPVVALSAATGGVPRDLEIIEFIPKPVVIDDLMRTVCSGLNLNEH